MKVSSSSISFFSCCLVANPSFVQYHQLYLFSSKSASISSILLRAIYIFLRSYTPASLLVRCSFFFFTISVLPLIRRRQWSQAQAIIPTTLLPASTIGSAFFCSTFRGIEQLMLGLTSNPAMLLQLCFQGLRTYKLKYFLYSVYKYSSWAVVANRHISQQVLTVMGCFQAAKREFRICCYIQSSFAVLYLGSCPTSEMCFYMLWVIMAIEFQYIRLKYRLADKHAVCVKQWDGHLLQIVGMDWRECSKWLKGGSCWGVIQVFIVFSIRNQKEGTMASWFMNFCAPFIPNDPTINFHRLVQTALLLAYTLFYITVHTYYLYCGSPPSKEPESPMENQIVMKKQEEKESESSENSSQNKEVSLKCDEVPNQSCIELKKSLSTWNNSKGKDNDKDDSPNVVTLQQIKQYFSIVYGHFAVAMGISIMYTPYAEQSLAALVYILLTIPLLIANSNRSKYGTRFVWILMTMVLVFIFTCGLLEVGQSNWDVLNLQCFSSQYVPLYS